MFYIITKEEIDSNQLTYHEFNYTDKGEFEQYRLILLDLFNEMGMAMKKYADDYEIYSKSQINKVLRFLHKNNKIIFLFKINNNVIGYSCIRKYKQNLNISEFLISNSYRSKGYGKQALKLIIDYAKENKIKFLNIRSYYNNTPAIKLYEHIGFKIFSIYKECDNILKQNIPTTDLIYHELNYDDKKELKHFLPTIVDMFNEMTAYIIRYNKTDSVKELQSEVEIIKELKDIYSHNGKLLLFTKDDVMVGYAIITISDYKHLIHMSELMIVEKYRSKGYGEQAINLVKSYAKLINRNIIGLNVISNNTNAVKLYDKMGFNSISMSMTLYL